MGCSSALDAHIYLGTYLYIWVRACDDFKVMGCFSAWVAHICLSTLSEQSIETLFLKDALGCSWDARDAQDAFQWDPIKRKCHIMKGPYGKTALLAFIGLLCLILSIETAEGRFNLFHIHTPSIHSGLKIWKHYRNTYISPNYFWRGRGVNWNQNIEIWI